MARLRIASLAAPAVAIAAVAGGCGSGKQQVGAAELKQKADAICREEQGRFERIQAHPPPNASIAADQTKELLGVSEAAARTSAIWSRRRRWETRMTPISRRASASSIR